MNKQIGQFHVLTDTVLQSRFSHTELTKLAISGGADTIQFRQKIGATRKMIGSETSTAANTRNLFPAFMIVGLPMNVAAGCPDAFSLFGGGLASAAG